MRIDTASGFRAGKPEIVFETELDTRNSALRPDGSGFVVIVEEETEEPAAEIRVLVGWQAASAP